MLIRKRSSTNKLDGGGFVPHRSRVGPASVNQLNPIRGLYSETRTVCLLVSLSDDVLPALTALHCGSVRHTEDVIIVGHVCIASFCLHPSLSKKVCLFCVRNNIQPGKKKALDCRFGGLECEE